MLVKDYKPTFIPEIHVDEVQGTTTIVEPDPNRPSPNFLEPTQILEFDRILGEACKICILDDLDQE